MPKSVSWLFAVLVFSQLLTLYWVFEIRDEFKSYRKLEESEKKNQTHLNSAFQRKILELERKTAAPPPLVAQQ